MIILGKYIGNIKYAKGFAYGLETWNVWVF